jgi:translation initiation factor IF-1
VRRLVAAAALVAVAIPVPGAATSTAGGLALSASPVRLRLALGAGGTVTVRNAGARPLRVDVSRAKLALSLRGRPRIRPVRRATAPLRVRPRRFRMAPHAAKKLHVTALSSWHAAPGDHPALVLLTTRPLGAHRVRVRLRVGVVVLVHVPGRIVRRLDPRALAVRRRGGRRLLELRLVNRGNVVELLDGGRLKIVLLRGNHALATLRPRRRELLPHSVGIAEFVYRGHVRGVVAARIELGRPSQGRPRVFRIRL